jgi:hypothetical protein
VCDRPSIFTNTMSILDSKGLALIWARMVIFTCGNLEGEPYILAFSIQIVSCPNATFGSFSLHKVHLALLAANCWYICMNRPDTTRQILPNVTQTNCIVCLLICIIGCATELTESILKKPWLVNQWCHLWNHLAPYICLLNCQSQHWNDFCISPRQAKVSLHQALTPHCCC